VSRQAIKMLHKWLQDHDQRPAIRELFFRTGEQVRGGELARRGAAVAGPGLR